MNARCSLKALFISNSGVLVLQRQAEGKNGALAKSACDCDRASMCLDDGFRDGQPHARSLDPVPLTFPPVKLLENGCPLGAVDSRTTIRDADELEAISLLGAYSD